MLDAHKSIRHVAYELGTTEDVVNRKISLDSTSRSARRGGAEELGPSIYEANDDDDKELTALAHGNHSENQQYRPQGHAEQSMEDGPPQLTSDPSTSADTEIALTDNTETAYAIMGFKNAHAASMCMRNKSDQDIADEISISVHDVWELFEQLQTMPGYDAVTLLRRQQQHLGLILDPSRHDEFRLWAKSGSTTDRIALHFDMTINAVDNRCDMLELPRITRTRKWSYGDSIRLARLCEGGMTYRELGDAFNCSPKTIADRLQLMDHGEDFNLAGYRAFRQRQLDLINSANFNGVRMNRIHALLHRGANHDRFAFELGYTVAAVTARVARIVPAWLPKDRRSESAAVT